MRRLLLTADAVGGVWTFACDLTAALEPRGVEVHVAVLGPEPTPTQLAALPAAAVHVLPCALEWMDDPWPDVDRSGAWLRAVADDVQPDVVHLNGYAHAGLLWDAPVVVGAHSDVVSWWHAVHGTDPPAAWDRYRDAVGAGLRAADVVVAPTAAVAADLARWYGLSDARVVHNGRAGGWVVHASKEPLVVAAGRLWDDAKNVAAVRALDGSIGCDVRTVAGMPFADLAELLARAAVFAHPARYEPFGLAPLEAAMSGCALVLGDIPSLREVWGDAAVFVDPDDLPGLRRAVASLIDDTARRDVLAAAAARRAARYGVDRMAEAYLDLYQSLAPVGAA